MLIPFMVIIETISNLIRPGTLAVRLIANIIAGHLILTLLGNNGPSIRHTLLTVLITAQILLLILEAAVAVIQSYVFAILRNLYIFGQFFFLPGDHIEFITFFKDNSTALCTSTECRNETTKQPPLR